MKDLDVQSVKKSRFDISIEIAKTSYPFDDSELYTGLFGNNYGLSTKDKDRATLIRYAFDKSNTWLNTLGSDCPSTTWRNNIVSPFINSSYTNSGNRQAYNQATVGNELKLRRPVIMDGTTSFLNFNNWHIWVLDGYKESRTSYISNGYCNTQTNWWFHHNWGWGNGVWNNTWCNPGNIVTGNNNALTYDSNLNATTGIRP